MTTTFRVATWNVLYRELEQREQRVLDELERLRADIVLLQETNAAHAERVAEAMGMRTVVCPSGEHGNVVPAVLAREASVDTDIVMLPDVGAPVRQFAVAATVPVGTHTVRAVSVHLRHTASAWRLAHGGALADEPDARATVADRVVQVEALHRARAGWIAADHEVIGGDMNFVPGGIEYAAIVEQGFRDAAEGRRQATVLAANPLIRDTPTDPALQRDYTLDFQFHDRRLDVARLDVFGHPDAGGVWPSDHLGVVVDYRA